VTPRVAALSCKRERSDRELGIPASSGAGPERPGAQRRERTNVTEVVPLRGETSRHVQRLTASWQLLADLCFSDLLLFAPLEGVADRFVIVAQVRPTTGQTVYPTDLVGTVVGVAERPLVARAFQSGEILEQSTEQVRPGANTAFSLAKPKGLKPGTYKVVLFLGDDSVDTKVFAVKK